MSKRKVTFVRPTAKDSRKPHYCSVHVDDYYVGEIHIAFTKPKEMENHFSNFRDEHWKQTTRRNAVRRGWVTTTELDAALGLRNKSAAFVAYPLRELKALTRHCLSNRITLEGISSKEVIALSKHCRAMELAQKRRGK